MEETREHDNVKAECREYAKVSIRRQRRLVGGLADGCMDTVIWIRAEKLGAVQTTNWAAVKVDLVQLTAFLV